MDTLALAVALISTPAKWNLLKNTFTRLHTKIDTLAVALIPSMIHDAQVASSSSRMISVPYSPKDGERPQEAVPEYSTIMEVHHANAQTARPDALIDDDTQVTCSPLYCGFLHW